MLHHIKLVITGQRHAQHSGRWGDPCGAAWHAIGQRHAQRAQNAEEFVTAAVLSLISALNFTTTRKPFTRLLALQLFADKTTMKILQKNPAACRRILQQLLMLCLAQRLSSKTKHDYWLTVALPSRRATEPWKLSNWQTHEEDNNEVAAYWPATSAHH